MVIKHLIGVYGYVPDQLPLEYRNATVYENLLYTVELRQIDRPQNRVEELIIEFDLSSVAQKCCTYTLERLATMGGHRSGVVSQAQTVATR